ncbi:bifunctional DedA family/phosphatase PAP2 family protein [Breoghania sp.]|uniref:bifunctional DedA family/phosphatase PAP2 family protein n=1 Tax=Breoghania sp. TaxID=2065378 RepID=UPI00260A0AA5|nr:bifunctional DedA family/phosphatase PAP2 family protein [Breoghania sp.]MDJ0931886.1 bifunctional DedA family/phosphatase PAP2 family protein [Breoghania sp.]
MSPMTFTLDLANWVISYLGENPHLSVAVVFMISMGEALLIIGLFVPSTVVLVGAGTLVGGGKLDFWPIFVATTMGAIIGDAVSYWAGRVYGAQLKRMWPLSRYPGLVTKSEMFFANHGGKSIAVGRFVPGVKAVISGIAGMMGMSNPRFLTINVLSAFVWSLTHLLPGVFIGKGLAVANQVSGRFAIVLFALIGAVFIAAWVIRVVVMSAIPLLINLQTRFVTYAAARPERVWQWLADTLAPENPKALRVVMLSAVLAAGGIGFASLLENLIAQNSLAYADLSIANLAQSVRNTPADRVMVAITMIGDGTVLIALGAVIVTWLLVRRAWTIAAAAIVTMASAALFVPFMKLILQSARPNDIFGGADLYTFTFPSGHATLATVVFGVLAVLIGLGLGRSGKAVIFACAGAIIVATACSRIYLGAHWPSDVAGGFLFGISMTAAFALALEATRPEKIAPVALGVVSLAIYGIVSFVYVSNGHATAMLFYSEPIHTTVITETNWRETGWADMPARRIELTGETGEPFIAQWAGPVDALEKRIRDNGWEIVPTWSWVDVLAYSDGRNRIDKLLPRPSLHEGQLANLSATRATPADDGRLVLRAWKTDTIVTGKDDERWPLVLISLTLERKKELPLVALPHDVPAPQEDVIPTLRLLARDARTEPVQKEPGSKRCPPMLIRAIR